MSQSAAPQRMVVHNVFFSLHDKSAESKQKQIDACWKYLAGHPGVVYFSVAVLAEPLNRPVNDREFDVALHMVFRSMADHDIYQTHPRHVQFIEENKPRWAKVRVFDSEVA